MLSHKTLLTAGLVSALALTVGVLVDTASAQEQPPGVVVQGSTDVQVGDLPAARGGDATTAPGGVVTEGSSDVFINGRPAARLGDRTNCGVIVRGSGNVFINGKPMARVGDNTSGC
jgi:uncharacterized Zn-binding protein involved in type VI secretion